MEDQDDIFVMADAASPKPVAAKPGNTALRLGGLAAILLAIVGIPLYFLISQRSTPGTLGSDVGTNGTTVSNGASGDGVTSGDSTSPTTASSVTAPSTSTTTPSSPSTEQVEQATALDRGTPLPKEVVTLYFPFDDITLTPLQASRLKEFWAKLQNKDGSFLIEGYADSIGNENYNLNLSRQRAEQVVKTLQDLGMGSSHQVKINSLGEANPATSNDTAKDRAFNRRVVVTFNPKN